MTTHRAAPTVTLSCSLDIAPLAMGDNFSFTTVGARNGAKVDTDGSAMRRSNVRDALLTKFTSSTRLFRASFKFPVRNRVADVLQDKLATQFLEPAQQRALAGRRLQLACAYPRFRVSQCQGNNHNKVARVVRKVRERTR
jgi:hypothetical protein